MSSLKVKVLESDIIKKMKRQATNWEKYLHDDEGFISRIYKESSKLNTEKTKYLKWGKDLN